ncbi:F-box/LRR-repeat protein [Lachnellula occidentalis]|uniref:F-box/LRR-repeat protein n=1 Tax=Lachnellula occidentalis TaxID=215460 RepID=A0A8H8RIN2_9HELO|nr:F-box/LRR-repeat protein [Lachnellula occidentalis]
MRRNRGGPSSPFRGNGAPIPDSLSLIRAFESDAHPTRPIRPSPLTASTIPDMPLDLVDRIRSFPLFLSAPDSFLAAIGKHLRPQVHLPHDHILTEGDDAKAMYWLVRGAVAVTSRDGEATYAELRPGAFFGEIGILMDVPRTATIIARTKCLLVVLKKEDLRTELPGFPEMERAIMEEAQERLTILNKKRKEGGYGPKVVSTSLPSRGGKVARAAAPGEVATGDVGFIEGGAVINKKKRKSPSPQGIEDIAAGSALGSGFVNVRRTLKELPLFSTLPPDILHFLGLSAQPKTYPPFTEIITQGSLGNEIYFIVRGEAEVIHETANGQAISPSSRVSYLRPRLKQGQYFGEVASLSLAPRRTATVRSITTVECLMISGEVLEELWMRCPPDIKRQVETTAKLRIAKPDSEDTAMIDVDGPPINQLELEDRSKTPIRSSLPQVTFTPSKPASPHKPSRAEDMGVLEPLDPDPFLSVDMDNMRTRGARKGSWAPPPSEAPEDPTSNPGPRTRSRTSTPTPSKVPHAITPSEFSFRSKRPKIVERRPSQYNRGILPDGILTAIFSYLDIYQLMRLRRVSLHWSKLLTNSPDLCHYLDLSSYNRVVTNHILTTLICPFVGKRARTINISNCFHITDEGFTALSSQCGSNALAWKMKSVWDISANAVLEMANNAKQLEEIDLSNCRKVSDNLLARIVGWVVTEPNTPQNSSNSRTNSSKALGIQAQVPPVGTVVGCPQLKRLVLSYCKHVTDRSMAHLAVHAHARLQSIDLTRCTTITDGGFQHWSIYKFVKLERLILADCTYLTDNAIVYLTNAAKGLRELDLSFCCALSDTATEVLSLGCPLLSSLKLSFCGSAVSDSSLRSIGLHLLELKELSVRGCVRVTGVGVEAVVEGCTVLERFDVSQCKNLARWLEGGGEERSRRVYGRKGLKFETRKGDGGMIAGGLR